MEEKPQSYNKEQLEVIDRHLKAAARMADRTEKEIFSRFTDNEINLVKEKWSGSQPSNIISFKERLVNQIVLLIPEKGHETIWKINKKKLLQKIMNLTEYQAFMLIRVSIQKRNIL